MVTSYNQLTWVLEFHQTWSFFKAKFNSSQINSNAQNQTYVVYCILPNQSMLTMA